MYRCISVGSECCGTAIHFHLRQRSLTGITQLMLQAGPVSNVHLPKDRVSMSHQGFGFCEFLTPEDAEYACKIMNQVSPLRVACSVGILIHETGRSSYSANPYVSTWSDQAQFRAFIAASDACVSVLNRPLPTANNWILAPIYSLVA